jgi:hypothetical protein
MITTVLADNTVKIPDTLARQLDLKPGSTLDWELTENGTLLVHTQRTRAQRADLLLGIGRACLQPGQDPIHALIDQRLTEDSKDHGPRHARP